MEYSKLKFKEKYENFINGKFVVPITKLYLDTTSPISQHQHSQKKDVGNAITTADITKNLGRITSARQRTTMLKTVAYTGKTRTELKNYIVALFIIFVYLFPPSLYSKDNTQNAIDSIVVVDRVYPILKGKEASNVLNLRVYSQNLKTSLYVEDIHIQFAEKFEITDLQMIYKDKEKNQTSFGTKQDFQQEMKFSGKQELHQGVTNFYLQCKVDEEVDLHTEVRVKVHSVKIANKTYETQEGNNYFGGRMGISLRKGGDDGIKVYRIPGLATTNKGSLIAVYDNRRNGSVDLQADIDVAMQRSIDGGNNWSPMKVIMDMKEWGGLPNDQNGIGDPAVLVDRRTNTIWVAAVWAHGHPSKRNWWASLPGIAPTKTSQFILVKSEDDGLTWSEPINITPQIKDTKWHLVLQGPGKGISLKDGTLVFPAQFKDENQMPHSTIIYSKDGGDTWSIGTGAKSNTTEAQVIELEDGGLMLNMRDNRNRKNKTSTNGRAVSTTYDLGQTWTLHHTSNKEILQEPNCMAGLLKDKFLVNGEMKNLVLFSNPNSKYRRDSMTIKVSFDEGSSWEKSHQKLLDTGSGRGYSCLTKIDDETVGILYEGSQADLIFQKVTIRELIGDEL